MNYIFDACGEENFNNLNELFHLFKDKCPGLKTMRLYEDLQNKIDNESTKTFYEIINKRDEILTSMIEYRKVNSRRK